MTRILYLVQGLGIGGAERQLLYLLEALDLSRFAPTVATFSADGPLRAKIEAARVPVVDLGLQFPLARPRNLPPMRRLLAWMRAERFDVVHAWLFHANVLAVLLGRRTGVPRIILSERDVGYFQRPIHRLAARWSYRNATRVTTNAQAIAARLLDQKLVRPDQLVVIPNGVSVPPVPPTADIARIRHRFGLPKDGLLVACVGRFAPVKGHRFLIDAVPQVLRRFPSASFALAGEGETLDDLRQQTRSLGLESQVKFVGCVDDVPEFLAGADVFVLPSLSEGLPNALMEAMAAGCPIVATAVGGNTELIDSGRSGLLVPPADSEELAEAICAQLAERTRAHQMGLAAWQRVAPYSIERMVARTVQLYEQTADELNIERRTNRLCVGTPP